MHPVQAILRSYCVGDLNPAVAREVEEHVRNCEFCQEFCDEYRALTEFVDGAADSGMNAAAQHAASYIYRTSLSKESIVLRPFRRESETAPVQLAADGTEKDGPRFVNLATFFSEQPEVVMRIMRDNKKQCDYLQLVSDDTNLISRVLVEVADLDMSIVTDENGRGDFEKPYLDRASALNWRIKMPQAEFTLEPLQYDPAKVEYSEDIVLETVRNDRLAIRFEGQKEGKSISIRILELDGRQDFEPVAVAVSQGRKSMVTGASQGEVLYFEMEETESSIDIRLFCG